jgi:hypothetical protein
MTTSIDDQDNALTMLVARDAYFRQNGFGADGGYSKPWVDFKFGGVPFPIPNSPARVAAVCFHDLHHVVTGYATTFQGELEISAWEIGAGCKNVWFAWLINLGGLAAGLMVAPRLTARAFARGLASDTLYGESYDALLGQTVTEVQHRLRVNEEDVPPMNVAGWSRFALAGVMGLIVGLLHFVVLLPLVPLGLATGHAKKRASLNAEPHSVRKR